MEKVQSGKFNVAVIMSTYNGAKYLKEQVISILLQTNVNVDLYIRDDGSSDSTQSILLELKNKYDNIHLFFEGNVGVGNSFMKCLYYAGAGYDYYAFSDQDDIWLPGKLIAAITVLKGNRKGLYASNQICVDQDGNIIGKRYESIPAHGVLDCLTNNLIAGCTFVFSNEMYRVLESHRPSEELLRNRIHDVWVAEVAALAGELIYDENSYIMYRQHDNNVVGAYVNNSFVSRLKRKISKFNNPEKRNGRSALAKEIFKLFPEYRSNDIIKYASNSNTLVGKYDLISHYELFKFYDSRFAFMIYVLLGLY